MKVISLFDGMSCGQIALNELGIIKPVYYASEIDKFAIGQTQLNFPGTIQLGNIENWREWDIDWLKVNLILAGSPCQGFSFAGKQLNFEDERSKLFFVFVDILNHIKKFNPNVKFLLENVIMRKEYQKVINDILGLYPVQINSNLVSAQNRKRLYWSNIKIKMAGLFNEIHSDIPQPKDMGILLEGILQPESEIDEKLYLTVKEIKRGIKKHLPQVWKSGNRNGKVSFPTKLNGKAKTLITLRIKGDRALNHILTDMGIRILSASENSTLQTIPEWYKWGCDDIQQDKMLGNGWTIEVIKHILNFIK